MQQCLSPRSLSASLRGVLRSLGTTGPDTLHARYPSPKTWRAYSVQTEAQRLESAAAWLDAAREVPKIGGRKAVKVEKARLGEQADDLDFILDGYEAVAEAPKRVATPKQKGALASQYSPPKEPETKELRITPSGGQRKRTAKPDLAVPPCKSRDGLQSTAVPWRSDSKAIDTPGSQPASRPALRRQRAAQTPAPDTPEAHQDDALSSVLKAQRNLSLGYRWGGVKQVLLQSSHPFVSPLSRVWHANFARVMGPYDKQLGHGHKSTNIVPLLNVHTAEWVENIIGHIEAGNPLDLDRLAEVHATDKQVIWSNCALWLMAYQPSAVGDFLQRTCSDGSLPSHWIVDSLTFASHQSIVLAPKERLAPVTELAKAFLAFANRDNAVRVALGGDLLSHLLHYCSRDQVPAIFQSLKTGNFRVPKANFLHVAVRLAKTNHFDQGIEALLEAHHAGVRVDSVAFRKVCALMFRQAMQQPGGLRVCLRLVDNLVKIGLRLTTRLCNILMLNAIEAGDIKTAHSIHKSLVTHDQEADVYTYALLLKACKQDLGDVETLNNVVRSAITDSNIVRTSVLATEILHCLVLHHTQQNTETAWSMICQAYRQLFDPIPLEELGLSISNATPDYESTTKPMPAPNQAIGIMLSAYLQLHSKRHAPTPNAHAIYKAYQTFYCDRIPPFTTLAHDDYLANAFLSAFTMSKRTLIHGAEMIKDMQRAAAHSPPIGTAPTVQTWSIFLRGFTYHGQTKLAEQVLTYMTSKGMKPSQATWNTLAQGYAHDQDVEGLVAAVSRAEDSGWVWDEWTSRGLRKLIPGRLRSFEERFAASRRVKIDFSEEIRSELEERLSKAGEEGASGPTMYWPTLGETVPETDTRSEARHVDDHERVEARMEEQAGRPETEVDGPIKYRPTTINDTFYDPERRSDSGDVDNAGPGAVMGAQ
ncbi:hypothetical protein B0A48_14848 [Cryoendolithus antarcticus]|uniref:Pentacotripeptide-repeat region of PRORP domain-containing protein n=1 Tax=Cryoendolithus antarcticus TaxID=1507870 RepID=A0A1V8SIM7_9PEZI|nr:hypothetical protein B0A48_14848 [Cryoendolithus antarcticus]